MARPDADTINPGRAVALIVLSQVEQIDAYAEIALNSMFQQTNLLDVDKRLASELVNGVLKWQLRLDFIINSLLVAKRPVVPIQVRNALRLALYQIIYLDRIPAFAAVTESVTFIKKSLGRRWAGLVNGLLRNYLREPGQIKWPDAKKQPIEAMAVALSHPPWLIQRWVRRFGPEQVGDLCRANNRIPGVFFRHNPLKISTSELEQILNSINIDFEKLEFPPGFYKTKSLPGIERFSLYRDGLISIQDAGAGLAVSLLAPVKDMTIIDLCSAPGGKSTRMAELMENTGHIISIDQNKARLNLVTKACARLGVRNTTFVLANAETFSAKPVDAVLVDVPCSGLGILAKKPDIKWRRQRKDIIALTTIQSRILENAAQLVRPGGCLVYSTCTIEPEENENIIEKFLSKHKNFVLDDAHDFIPARFVNAPGFVITLPHRDDMDGSFAARLKKLI